jgi:tetratricopeptide (TPR) repeat protein
LSDPPQSLAVLAQDGADRQTANAVTDDADRLRLRGRYDEALERYAEQKTDDPRRWWGIVQIHAERGQEADAAAAAAEGWRESRAPELAAWLARRAIAAGDQPAARQHWEEALSVAGEAAQRPYLLLTKALLRNAEYDEDQVMSLLEQLAELRRKGVDAWNDDDALALGEAGTWLAQRQGRATELQALRKEWWPRLIERQPLAWRAHAGLAEIAWRQHNGAAAAEAIDRGLAVNPFAGLLLGLRGQLALDDYQLDRAAQDAERALELCANEPWAQRVLIDVALTSGDLDQARQRLEDALKQRPYDPELIGRSLAMHRLGAMADLSISVSDYLEGAETPASDAQKSLAFHAEGESLLRMRRLPQAADAFRRGLQAAPRDSELAGDLALVLSHLGDAKEVQGLLDQAIAGDPSNLRARNMREVLRTLDRYESRQQGPVTLRFDPALRAEWIELLLDEIQTNAWPRVTRAFGHDPEHGALIEIFRRADGVSGHAWFSARMTALPFVDTVAACTGSAVACTAPEELQAPLHWGDTLRHELVHVVHLSLTQHGVPHWLTEGLAVESEDRPRSAEWQHLLSRAMLTGSIFDPTTINAGFIRPRTPQDRPTAYAQAEWYMEWVRMQFGDEAPLKMLELCREGADPSRSLAALSLRPDEFQKQFLSWAWPQVALWSWTLDKQDSKVAVGHLDEMAASNPDSPDLAALRIMARWKAGEPQWDADLAALAERFPEHAAVVALTGLQAMEQGQVQEAMRRLGPAVRNRKLSDDGWRLWIKCAQQLEDPQLLRDALLAASEAATEPTPFLKPLAAIQLQTKDAGLEATLAQLANWQADTAIYPQKLLSLAVERGDAQSARRWAREVLLRSPNDQAAWGVYLAPRTNVD